MDMQLPLQHVTCSFEWTGVNYNTSLIRNTPKIWVGSATVFDLRPGFVSLYTA